MCVICLKNEDMQGKVNYFKQMYVRTNLGMPDLCVKRSYAHLSRFVYMHCL